MAKKPSYNALSPSTWDKVETRQPGITDIKAEICTMSELKVGMSFYDMFLGVWRGVVSVRVGAEVTFLALEDEGVATFPNQYATYFVKDHQYFGWSSAEAAQYFIDK